MKVNSFGDVSDFIFMQKDIFLIDFSLQVISQLTKLAPWSSLLYSFFIFSSRTIQRSACLLPSSFGIYVLFITFGQSTNWLTSFVFFNFWQFYQVLFKKTHLKLRFPSIDLCHLLFWHRLLSFADISILILEVG